MGDNISYQKILENEYVDYEKTCKRCGACCDVNDCDPCKKLIKDKDGLCYCGIYDNRIGPQKTISGKDFTCVLIRNVKKFGAAPTGCAYKQR
ncbi:MAG: hypothetical protein HQ579_07150 [Candidatus Omnitrophica bacterium]|nr:hypothetical protein [Candidatus Omnitrophota bacterium]